MNRAARVFVCLAAALVTLAVARSAEAFPWMIRHDYTGCAQCHVDPSGAGILTEYGRAQSELLLSTRWSGGKSEEEEPSRFSRSLFGVFQMPDWLLVQAWSRNAYIWNTMDGKLVDRRYLQMRDDVGFAIHKDALRASVVLGYNDMQSAAFSQQAWLTSASSFGNLVSREYWAGAALADESILIRGGRITLPFGLRNIEHNSFVRAATRTDVNQDQQHGLAVAYNTEHIRAEAMAVLGNYQVRPDEFRDRGYAAYGEYHFGMHWAAGVSSLVLHAQRDLFSNVETWRQAHGAFARAAPIEPVVVLVEFDALVNSPAGSNTQTGYTGLLQVDVEPLQGVHVLGTGEVLNYGIPGQSTNVGTWLGAMWFPVSHFELRGDVIRYTAPGTPTLMTYLLQGQLYL